MAVRDALAKVEQYNAAMELPFSGILGIQAYLGESGVPQPSLAQTELQACAELCQVAELALSGSDVEAARANVHLYSALREILRSEEERQEYRAKFAEVRNAIGSLLKQISGEPAPEPPQPDYLRNLAGELRLLAERIKRAIPRDAYLTSLTSLTQPGPVTRGQGAVHGP